MFQLSVNKLYAVGKLIFLALKWCIFPPNFKYFLRKKNIFWRWLIYRGFLAVGKVGKRVRPVARFLTSEKDLFRRTNVWGPVSQRASAGMTSGWPLSNFLLTEREGRTAREILARGRGSTDRAQRGPYKNDPGPIIPSTARAGSVSK